MRKKQRVIEMVMQQSSPFYSSTITSLSGSSIALVSNTLNELLDAGKISSRKEGKKLVYTLSDGANNRQMTITSEPICNMEEKFEYIRNLVDMVITGVQPSIMITGQPGVGKTFVVHQQLKAAGMERDKDYLQVSGHSSPFGLYKLLHDRRDATILFDDTDSVFLNSISTNILKAALDSYDTRWISWYSDKAEQQELDPSFEFTGKIIFISNLFMDRIDSAIRSRAFCFELKMSNNEISEHMQNVLEDIEPKVDMILKQEVLDHLKTIQNEFETYSLRILIQAIRIRKYCQRVGGDWKQMIRVLTRAV